MRCMLSTACVWGLVCGPAQQAGSTAAAHAAAVGLAVVATWAGVVLAVCPGLLLMAQQAAAAVMTCW
jgi:hypothetical protein